MIASWSACIVLSGSDQADIGWPLKPLDSSRSDSFDSSSSRSTPSRSSPSYFEYL